MAVTEETERLGGAAAGGDEALVLGRYRLGRRLGAGGFGAVHEAVDELLDRRVAVKVIAADGATPHRARREAVAAARLDHPGIVSVYDAGEEPGARYLVSELVEGRTLAALEADKALGDRDVLRVGLALCDALAHAHERGVVHRDVKPQNVLVPDRPRTWRGAAKLADFGVAMLAGDDPLTMTGDVVGTLAYMAPEQAAGRRVDDRADLYALALVLYEALAGDHPVRGASPAETIRRVGLPVPSLARPRPDLPAELAEAIDRALDVAPAARGTLDDLADALEDALPEVGDDEGTVVRHPVERGIRVPGGMLRGAAAGAAGVLVAVAATMAAAPPVPAPAAGLVAAVLVVGLPRLGWALSAAGVLGLLVMDGRVGAALLLALAVLPVPFLLRREPLAWSAPALAPALGALALAGAFPALAGRLPRWFDRAALGALGAWWLVLVAPLAGRGAPWAASPRLPSPEQFEGALYLTAGEVVGPAVTSGAIVLAGVWALAALALPLLVRGESLAVRAIGASAWAGALAAGTAGAGEALGLGEPKGLVPGTVLAATIAALRDVRYSGHDDGE